MARLFNQIPKAVTESGLPKVCLSCAYLMPGCAQTWTLRCHHFLQIFLDRFDLFHAHLFIAGDIGAGLLFHAAEYPALAPDFKFNLGFCQQDSSLQYSEAKMSWRNLVFMKARPSTAMS